MRADHEKQVEAKRQKTEKGTRSKVVEIGQAVKYRLLRLQVFYFLTKNEARALGTVGFLYALGLIVQTCYHPAIPLYEAIYAREDSLFALAEQQAAAEARLIEEHTDSMLVPGAPAFPIPLNHAQRDDLIRIPRIGPATADRILELRESRGRLRSVEDLLDVRGIGEKTLERIRPYVTVSDSLPLASAPPARE